MNVKDVFFVNTPGKGAVLAGRLDGNGLLRVGDVVTCGEQVFEILSIQRGKHVLKEVEGGCDVGLALGGHMPLDGFEGRSVSFLPRPGSGVPALTPQGWAVPSQTAVMVGWSDQRGVARPRFGALVFDGLTVALHDEDDSEQFSVHGSRLVVRAIGTTLSVVNREEDTAARYIVGPDPHWAGSPRAATLLAKQHAQVYPDLRLAAPPPWWHRIVIMPASRALNRKIIWRDVLLTMLRTRGAVTINR